MAEEEDTFDFQNNSLRDRLGSFNSSTFSARYLYHNPEGSVYVIVCLLKVNFYKNPARKVSPLSAKKCLQVNKFAENGLSFHFHNSIFFGEALRKNISLQ